LHRDGELITLGGGTKSLRGIGARGRR
jgi:hypothetical protein